MEKNDIERYREMAIKSAGKLKSILMLLNRAIVYLKEIRENEALRSANITKAQNILAQLEQALNFDEGKLAGDLFFIFDYLFAELNRQDDNAVETSIKMLQDLKATFQAVQNKHP